MLGAPIRECAILATHPLTYGMFWSYGSLLFAAVMAVSYPMFLPVIALFWTGKANQIAQKVSEWPTTTLLLGLAGSHDARSPSRSAFLSGGLDVRASA